MADLRNLTTALDEHLEAMARHIDVGAGDADLIPMRARRQRRRRAARRAAAALVCVVALVGVLTVAGAGDESSSVDTVDDAEVDTGPDPVDEETRTPRIQSFEASSPMVIGAVHALGRSWGAYVVSGGMAADDVTVPGDWSSNRLLESVDGITWEPVDDVTIDGFAGMTGRDDLLAVAYDRDGSIVIETFDDVAWTEAVLPTDEDVRLVSVGSSPTHLLAMVQLLSPRDVVREGVAATLRERFGAYDSLSMGDDGILTVSAKGEVLFEGTPAQAGLDLEAFETYSEGPVDEGPAEYALWVSEDGLSWQQGVLPPANPDNVTPVAFGTDFGLAAVVDGGFAYSSDGRTWSFVELAGTVEGDPLHVQRGRGWVVASTPRVVATAESMAGPFTPVIASESPDTWLAAMAGPRGLVVVESTFESTDGIDSAAEAESLGLDGDDFAPRVRTRVLGSADGRRLEPLDIDVSADRYLFPHVVAADGWIVVRAEDRANGSMAMGDGYRIDPGG